MGSFYGASTLSCVILIVILQIRLKKGNFSKISVSAYNSFIRVLVTFSILDAAWGFLFYSDFAVSDMIMKAILCTMFTMLTVIGYAWYGYTEAMLDSGYSSNFFARLIASIPSIAIFLLLNINIQNDLFFDIEDRKFSFGPLFGLPTVCFLVYYVVSFIRLTIYAKKRDVNALNSSKLSLVVQMIPVGGALLQVCTNMPYLVLAYLAFEVLFQYYTASRSREKSLLDRYNLAESEKNKLSGMLAALTEGYSTICNIHPDGRLEVIRLSTLGEVKYGDYLRSMPPFGEALLSYIRTTVMLEDTRFLTPYIDMAYTLNSLKVRKECVVNYRTIRMDGEIRYFEMKLVRIESAEGTGFVAAFGDCQERQEIELKKRLEIERQAYEARKKDAIIKSMIGDYDCIVYAETDTGAYSKVHQSRRWSEWSKAASKDNQLGQDTFERKMSLFARDCVVESDRAAFLKAISLKNLKAELKKSTVFFFNFKLKDGESEEFYQVKAVSPTKRKDIILGFHSIDLTMRKEMAYSEKLSGALDKANLANEAKTRFLFNMSHDIRTPMNAIIGFTGQAAKHVDQPEKVRDYLGKVTDASEYLLELINNVLDMSRIDSGKMVFEEKPVNIIDNVNRFMPMMEEAAAKKNITVSYQYSGITQPYVWMDDVHINQVNLNLIGNAIKYTPEGGKVTVAITQKSCRKKGYAAFELRVSDNGIGMSKEFVRRIYEPFTREHSTTMSKVQGTGLGMSITKSIIDILHGHIKVDSTPGEGTDVIVRLDFKIYEKGNEPETIRPVSRDFDAKGKRILLVEDNELNRELAMSILEEQGFEMEAVENGKLACDRVIEAEPGYFDCVLMDIQMPVMDGYEATISIRGLADKARANVPIIAMTANAFTEDKQHAIDVGMNGHISKPINIVAMMQTIEDVIISSKARKENIQL